MSIGSIWLIANWLLEGQFGEKFQRFKTQKILWLIIGFFVFSILTLFWSEDLNYGFHDLRIKLPFLIIPLVIGTAKPLSKEMFYAIIYAFLIGLLVSSIYNYWKYTFDINESKDIRTMSHFISHVRYSILVNLGIFFTYYLILKRKLSILVLIIAMVWLVFYQYASQTINGYALFILLFILSLLYWINQLVNRSVKRSIFIGFGALTLSFLGSVFYFWYQSPSEIETVDFSELELYTSNHNGYYHIKKSDISEEGRLVYLYISEKECRKAWKTRSKMSFDGQDNKGQKLQGTLYRYMTSMGVRKDSIGFLSLSNQDIVNIENGFSNYNINKGLIEKISDLKMQMFTFKTHGDPNGNSLIQRQIHLSTGIDILKANWIFGIGIGDVKLAFSKQYNLNHSELHDENRHRSHNQFLTFWISHGLLGLFFSIFLFVYPFKVNIKACDYLLCVILLSFAFSFFWQDMLETQAGVTIFSIFYSLVIFKPKLNGTS